MTTDAIIATLVLGGMCFAMWLLARIAKRRMGVGAGTVHPGALRVVGKRPLDPRSSLYIVEIAGGRHIIVGAGADGTVTKVDDVTPEEYELMAGDDPAPVRRPRLRVAATGGETSPAATTAAAGDGTVDSTDEAEEQRFATVGESFSMLLGRARDARARRSG